MNATNAVLAGTAIIATLVGLAFWFLIAQLVSARSDLTEARLTITGLEVAHTRAVSALGDCEGRRDEEDARCVALLDGAEANCQTRIQEALEGAQDIREVAYACPTFDESRCPRRDVIDADELRRSIRARGPG